MKNQFCKAAVLFLFFVSPAFSQEKKILTFENVLQSAISKNYEVQVKQAALLSASGSLKSIVGETDLSVGASFLFKDGHAPQDSDAPSYNGLDDTETRSFETSIWAKKIFSFGLQSKLSLGLAGGLDLYNGKSAVEEYFKNQYGTELTNRGNVALELSLPIFKSFNSSILEKNIQAAKDSYAQLQYELENTVCETVLKAADLYWQYLVAHNKLSQYETMQQRLEERVQSLEKLISAGVRSKNDLLSAQVRLITNERDVVQAKLGYENAKLSLLGIMGIDGSIDAEPEYVFPNQDFSEMKIPAGEDVDVALIDRVCNARPDILALQKKLSAAQKSRDAAVANARPDASLNFAIGSSGVVYGDNFGSYISSFARNVPGANISAGASVSVSVPNNTGKGKIEMAEASLKQAQAQLAQAKNTLASQIRLVTKTMENYHEQVKKANDVLEMQNQLYKNAQKRFESGLITIDDMFTQDANYLDAQAQYYSIMVAYLQSILQYKYYTGALVELTDADTSVLHKDSLYTNVAP